VVVVRPLGSVLGWMERRLLGRLGPGLLPDLGLSHALESRENRLRVRWAARGDRGPTLSVCGLRGRVQGVPPWLRRQNGPTSNCALGRGSDAGILGTRGDGGRTECNRSRSDTAQHGQNSPSGDSRPDGQTVRPCDEREADASIDPGHPEPDAGHASADASIDPGHPEPDAGHASADASVDPGHPEPDASHASADASVDPGHPEPTPGEQGADAGSADPTPGEQGADARSAQSAPGQPAAGPLRAREGARCPVRACQELRTPAFLRGEAAARSS
jgi:hypothetical protein